MPKATELSHAERSDSRSSSPQCMVTTGFSPPVSVIEPLSVALVAVTPVAATSPTLAGSRLARVVKVLAEVQTSPVPALATLKRKL